MKKLLVMILAACMGLSLAAPMTAHAGETPPAAASATAAEPGDEAPPDGGGGPATGEEAPAAPDEAQAIESEAPAEAAEADAAEAPEPAEATDPAAATEEQTAPEADAPGEAPEDLPPAGEPSEILVIMKTQSDEKLVVETMGLLGDEALGVTELGDGEKMVVVETMGDVDEAIAAYEQDPNVAYAERNFRCELDYMPNDPMYTSQWALATSAATNIAQAWDLLPAGAAKTRVAVLDTGYQIGHPDLAASFNTTYMFDATDPTGRDTDVSIDPGQTSTVSHGNHVAGIIAANTNNRIGVAGVSNNKAEIVPIKVFDADGCTIDDLVRGILHAIKSDCRVINMSLGTYSDSIILKDVIDKATNAGILVVAAGGNSNRTDTHYPSDFDNVLAVTWTDANNVISPHSDHNAKKDIAAPGVNIYSTVLGSSYGTMSGSSMASPYVAGVAALVMSANPSLPSAKIAEILKSNAIDLGAPGRDNYYGYGLVDAKKSVEEAMKYHTVTFLDYNGTLLGTQCVYQGQAAAAPKIPARAGYTFTGWSAPITNITADLTVTAQYKLNPYRITFDANGGGTPAVTTKTISYGQTLGVLPVVKAKPGRTFLGWYTAKAGGTKVSAATAYRTYGNTTYYAHWRSVKNQWVKDAAGKWYYIGAAGEALRGWHTIGGAVRYFDPAQGGACPQGWFVHSNGKKYYFWWGGKGVFATGLTEIGGRAYCFNDQGHLQSGWRTVNGHVRYFDPAQGGAAPRGWFKHSNGKTYYFWWGGQGIFATGRTQIGGHTYYFNNQGHLIR
ncbi:MAG: S8 family serine peptidase [Clostridiales Family XIII bacterium]|jgi:uncharacterized repeat protein (TIGR02543 family)|nr:S8 family serine peptidase [Clostridiales Family XIII bacterium]